MLCLRKNIFYFCLALFCISPYAHADEVPSYSIDCKVDVASHTLRAHERVVFTNPVDHPIQELFFHIYPNRHFTEQEKQFITRYAGYFKMNPFPEGFQSGSFTIHSVTQNAEQLDFEITLEDKTILKVILPEPVAAHETVEVEIDFSARIPHSYGRFGWHENIISLARWYPLLSVLDEEGWHNYPFYPYHQPFFAEAATYNVNLTVPTEQIIAHTGLLKNTTEHNDGTKTLSIETELPVRDFTLTLSPDYRVFSLEQNNVKINSYYLPGDEFYGKQAAQNVATLMDNYSRQFGDYPYREFNIAPVFLGYGGNQASNIILIDTRAYTLPKFLIRYFDFLISHEAGHQWFYNMVGSDEYKEMWIDEGINSYFISEYLEEKYGPDAQVMVLPKGFKHLIPNFSFENGRIMRYMFVAKNGLDRPVLGELSSFQEPSSIFTLAYGKGSLVMQMLRSLVGEETFQSIMKRYFQDYAFKNISVADVVRIAEEESAQELDWFFDQWLYTDKTCDYAITEVRNNTITVENRGQIIMPVKTTIAFSDGTTKDDYWDGQGDARHIEADGSGVIRKVIVDPDSALLDIDRTNNLWPRSLEVQAVPLYFFAYEIPVFLSHDSYSLIYGPEVRNGGLGIRATLQKPFDNIISLSTTFDVNSSVFKAVLGFEQKNILNTLLSAGIEVFKDEDPHGKNEDLDGGKVYIRRELWPARYGLTEINDHVTLYLLRNRKFEGSLIASGKEDPEGISYKRKHEAIVGLDFSFDRAGPYFDPEVGYRVKSTIEHADHFMGGKEAFSRCSVDVSKYVALPLDQKLAFHLKVGWGFPSDKNLYELGGNESLRGYGHKALRGSRVLLGSVEYRFPIWKNINTRFLDNTITLQSLHGAAFYDAGRIWHAAFSENGLKHDAGLGIRAHIDIASFLEKIILRIDIAQAIDEPKEDPHVWFGISHTF
ncbi:M1 family aminopeptidase [Candidatus Omnitrophota bacterium]